MPECSISSRDTGKPSGCGCLLQNICKSNGVQNSKTLLICAYIEYLVDKKLKLGTIRNHISALTTYMLIKSWNHEPFQSLGVTNALKALELQIRHAPNQKAPVTPDLLKNVVSIISHHPNGKVINLALIIMFMAFLRQSNVLPISVAAFDPSRHITVGDVTLSGDVLTIRVKWSKTQQTLGDYREVHLNSISGSPLCPVAAFQAAMSKKLGCCHWRASDTHLRITNFTACVVGLPPLCILMARQR